MRNIPPILLAAINPDSQGIWNQPKLVAILGAALVLVVLVGCVTMALGAKKATAAQVGEHVLKYGMIFFLAALVVGGALFVIGDKIAQAVQ